MPYNPQVRNRGGLLLGAGISKLGDRIWDYAEKRKNENQTAKGLSTILKANPEMMAMTGASPEEWEGMSSAEQVAVGQGAVSSFQSQQDQKKQAANLKHMGSLSQSYDSARERTATGDRQLGNIFKGMSPQQIPIPAGPRGGVSMQTVQQNPMQTLGQNPVGAQQLGAGAMSALAGGGKPGPQLDFRTDPQSGATVATYGNSMQLVPPNGPPAVKPDIQLRGLEAIAELKKEKSMLEQTPADQITPVTHKRLKDIQKQIDQVESVIQQQVGRAQIRGDQGAPPAPTADGGMVTVISPDGKPGKIPAANLDRALQQGFKRAGN